ncbi:MAG: iron ABC transporter permease [Syntrophaceae bacterium]|nr:iron ABC transporter permease [Syntrophaceae bacterium]
MRFLPATTTYGKTILLTLFLSLLLVFTAVCSLFWGTTQVDFLAILNWDRSDPETVRSISILFSYRLPRVLLAAIAGAGLACSGVVFQGVLRNPLADPYIIGIAAGGALGAVISISVLKVNWILATTFASFVGSLIAVMTVYGLTFLRKNTSYMNTVILAGIIVGALMNALMLLMMSMTNSSEIQRILFWIMGDFSLANYQKIFLSAPIVLVGFIYIYLNASRLNILVLQEESALGLGVNVKKVRFLLITTASLITGAVVSVSGTIGFVGLVAPHSMRLLLGPDHRMLLPVSFLSGSIFLVVSDTLARMVSYPVELPVGVITALSGAPFFLYLLLKK